MLNVYEVDGNVVCLLRDVYEVDFELNVLNVYVGIYTCNPSIPSFYLPFLPPHPRLVKVLQ